MDPPLKILSENPDLYFNVSVNISALSITNNVPIAYVFNHLAGTTCKYSTVKLFLAQQVLFVMYM